ncbi:MAG: DsbA family oxidoreductase [Terriglobales bacterium]
MAEAPLKQAAEGKDVRIDWMPFELRPAPTPTLKPEGDYLQTAWKRSVYPLAEKLGVEIKLPTVSPQPYTNLAFQGLEFAKDHGKADEYNDAVFRAFFQQSRDIGNMEVLSDIAREAGLDPADFRKTLEQGTYSERVAEMLRVANRHVGIQAVPTIIVGHRRLNGLYPAEVLREVIDEELARPGQ